MKNILDYAVDYLNTTNEYNDIDYTTKSYIQKYKERKRLSKKVEVLINKTTIIESDIAVRARVSKRYLDINKENILCYVPKIRIYRNHEMSFEILEKFMRRVCSKLYPYLEKSDDGTYYYKAC